MPRIRLGSTGGYLHPYNFTLEDELGASISYTITDNFNLASNFTDHPQAMNAVTRNGYAINYYKAIPNDQYAIGDTFTLSYDVTKTVRKVHIGNYVDARSVDVQVQVGGANGVCGGNYIEYIAKWRGEKGRVHTGSDFLKQSVDGSEWKLFTTVKALLRSYCVPPDRLLNRLCMHDFPRIQAFPFVFIILLNSAQTG